MPGSPENNSILLLFEKRMKDKSTDLIRKAKGVITLLLFFATVLISSCTVRKSLQAYLDIPVTRSLNAAKATISKSSPACQAILQAVYAERKAPGKVVVEPLAPVLPYAGLSVPLRAITPPITYDDELSCVASFPLYILYQKMKLPFPGSPVNS